MEQNQEETAMAAAVKTVTLGPPILNEGGEPLAPRRVLTRRKGGGGAVSLLCVRIHLRSEIAPRDGVQVDECVTRRADVPHGATNRCRPIPTSGRRSVQGGYSRCTLPPTLKEEQELLSVTVGGSNLISRYLNCGLAVGSWLFTKAMRPVVADLR